MYMIKEYIEKKKEAFKNELNIKHGFVITVTVMTFQNSLIDHFWGLHLSCHIISD